MSSQIITEMPDGWQPPIYLRDCPIKEFDWVIYKKNTYCTVLNYKESELRQKPVFNLAYCITKAMNEIWVKEGVLYENKNIKPTEI